MGDLQNCQIVLNQPGVLMFLEVKHDTLPSFCVT